MLSIDGTMKNISSTVCKSTMLEFSGSFSGLRYFYCGVKRLNKDKIQLIIFKANHDALESFQIVLEWNLNCEIFWRCYRSIWNVDEPYNSRRHLIPKLSLCQITLFRTHHHNCLQWLNIWFLSVEQFDNNMCSKVLKIEREKYTMRDERRKKMMKN